MKPIHLLPFLAATGSLAFTPFSLPSLRTHQPNGNPGGQVNYYSISFDITSTNGDATASAYCHWFWGDNGWTRPEAYSVWVPTDEWITCAVSEDDLGNRTSAFQLMLFPYFSIGNFSVAVRQNLTDGTILYGKTHITNQTDEYTCEINPQEVPYQQHAQGDCNIAEGKGPFEISVSLEEARCIECMR